VFLGHGDDRPFYPRNPPRRYIPLVANPVKKPGPEPETLKVDIDPEEGLDRLLRARPKPPPKPKRKRNGTSRKS